MPELTQFRRGLLFVMITAVVVAGSFWWLCERSRDISFLPGRQGASWILYPTPPEAHLTLPMLMFTEFRRPFALDAAPGTATLSVRAFKRCLININGQLVEAPIRTGKTWKDRSDFDIAGLLRPGTNEISVTVFNDDGPPALWLTLRVGTVSLNSDDTWSSSYVGGTWKPARLAGVPVWPARGNPLYGGEKPVASLCAELPQLMAFAVLSGMVAALGCWWINYCERQPAHNSLLRPQQFWLLMIFGLGVAWAALWANNLGQLVAEMGFDHNGHLDYITYILEHHSLPLADQGWEMYQPPLYYVICADLLRLFHYTARDADGIFTIRMFGMVCSIAGFILAALSLRLVFPNRPRPQWFGLLLAALLPPAIYLGHYASNELLAAVFVAAAVYCCLRILKNPLPTAGQHAIAGLMLGAALLTKSSAAVALVIILPALAGNLWTRKIRSPAKWVNCLGLTVLVCAAVCGWQYCRVWSRFGNPLAGNWDVASGYHWWQQPGFRDASYYFSFGNSLVDPFFSSFVSFWDGLYSTLWGDGMIGSASLMEFRPPWNYELVAAGYLFALLPTTAILIGAVITLIRFIRDPQPEGFLLLGLPVLAGILLIYYSLKIPSFAAAKAFYGSAALVPVCIFGATGWEFLMRKTGKLRHLLCVMFGVWALTAYASFWIPANSLAARMLVAESFSWQARHDQAAFRYLKIMEQYPRNARVIRSLAEQFLELGNLKDARRLADQCVELAPNDAQCRMVLALVLSGQGLLEPAIEQAKRAASLAPDYRDPWACLADWLDRLGRKQEALAACREAVRIAPDEPGLHKHLAGLLEDTGDATEAATQLRLVTELDRFSP